MKIAYFTHSLRSCWNHGNAHFQRGLLRALQRLGHEVCAYEPEQGWSLENLLRDQGADGLRPFLSIYPDIPCKTYALAAFDAEACVEGCDVVLAHEWTAPEALAALNRLRARGARFRLFFHDTHHRAVSDPKSLATLDLSAFDGVLAFGASVAEAYRRRGWARQAHIWHEAADDHVFQPRTGSPRRGLVWIGNWGDDERAQELETFLLQPAAAAGLPLDVHGVRYPPSARGTLERYAARYRGWLANPDAPGVYAAKLATVHVPRAFYAKQLPGVPTIRVFEALACGVPLASAPWDDCEGLFTAGRDYLLARTGAHMTRHLRALAHDADLRAALSANGLAAIRARHTCTHRARELLNIVADLQPADAAA